MRAATRATARQLRKAIGKTRYSTWARAAGLQPMTVRAVLSALTDAPISVSAKRENTVRAVLGLPPLPLADRTVTLQTNQSVITRRGPAPYVSRQIRLTPQQAEVFDEWVRQHEAVSFNELWHSAIADWLGVPYPD